MKQYLFTNFAVMRNDAALARPAQMQWFNVYFRDGNGYESRGIAFSKEEEWQDQRRFLLRYGSKYEQFGDQSLILI